MNTTSRGEWVLYTKRVKYVWCQMSVGYPEAVYVCLDGKFYAWAEVDYGCRWNIRTVAEPDKCMPHNILHAWLSEISEDQI